MSSDNTNTATPAVVVLTRRIIRKLLDTTQAAKGHGMFDQWILARDAAQAHYYSLFTEAEKRRVIEAANKLQSHFGRDGAIETFEVAIREYGHSVVIEALGDEA